MTMLIETASRARRWASAPAVEISYALLDTPLGRMVAAATPRGLVRLAYADLPGGVERILGSLEARLEGRVVARPDAAMDDLRRQLDEYFAGRRREFDIKLDWSLSAGFGRRVLEETARVPYGETATYGQIAERAGNPRAARAAGRALGANALPIVVPCHRIVGSSGRLTGYTGGLQRKVALLKLESALP